MSGRADFVKNVYHKIKYVAGVIGSNTASLFSLVMEAAPNGTTANAPTGVSTKQIHVRDVAGL